MVTITNNNIRAGSFESVYDYLKGKATTSDYSTTPQPLVTASYPDDNETFPCIVINPIQVDRGDYTFDRSNTQNDIVVVIEIYAKKNKNRDLLGDNIQAFMDSNKFQGLHLNSVTETNAPDDINSTKIRYKSISFTYGRR